MIRQHIAKTTREILDFLFKDYPAFFWQRPSIRRLLSRPFLLLYVIVYGKKTGGPTKDI